MRRWIREQRLRYAELRLDDLRRRLRDDEGHPQILLHLIEKQEDKIARLELGPFYR